MILNSRTNQPLKTSEVSAVLDNNDIMLSLLRTSLCHCTKDIAGPDTAANWLVEGQDTPTLRIYAGESRDITDSRKLAYLLQIADEFNLPSDVDQDRRWSLIRISLATGLRNDAYMSELAPLIRDFAVEHTHDAWISTLETFILLNGLSDELPASDLLQLLTNEARSIVSSTTSQSWAIGSA